MKFNTVNDYYNYLNYVNTHDVFETHNEVQFKNVDIAFEYIENAVMEKGFKNKENASNWRDAYYKLRDAWSSKMKEPNEQIRIQFAKDMHDAQHDMWYWENKEYEEQLERTQQTC